MRIILMFFVAVFSSITSAVPGTSNDITILVSIDGFRADYLDRGITPVLNRLAADGVRSAMEPSFPSVTFPTTFPLSPASTRTITALWTTTLRTRRSGECGISMISRAGTNRYGGKG